MTIFCASSTPALPGQRGRPPLAAVVQLGRRGSVERPDVAALRVVGELVSAVAQSRCNQPGTTAASAVSKVAGVAFTRSLIGPPLIGLLTELASPRTALFVVAAAAMAIGTLGPRAVRPHRS